MGERYKARRDPDDIDTDTKDTDRQACREDVRRRDGVHRALFVATAGAGAAKGEMRVSTTAQLSAARADLPRRELRPVAAAGSFSFVDAGFLAVFAVFEACAFAAGFAFDAGAFFALVAAALTAGYEHTEKINI